MIWFFAFTNIGIAIIIFFLMVKELSRIPLRAWFSGATLLITSGLLTFKVIGT